MPAVVLIALTVLLPRHPPSTAACLKQPKASCPSYALLITPDNTRIITTGPRAGKCAAMCSAGQLIFSDGTCGSCNPGSSFSLGQCVLQRDGQRVPVTITTPAVSGAQTTPATQVLTGPCPANHINCGSLCVGLPRPAGDVCYMASKTAAASTLQPCVD